jgi:hypothetical protein
VRKINKQTWIPSIARLVELTSETQALVGTGGRMSFPHIFEGQGVAGRMKAIYSSIVAPCMVAKHNGEHYPMTSGGKVTHAIKIGRLNTCTIRTKLNNWGRKRCHNHNGHQQFPNGCAKILRGGTQEVSQKVVMDEKPSCVM